MPETWAHVQLVDAEPPGEDETLAIAEIMQALSAPSRLRLLYALRDREANVSELAELTGLTTAAASQQLRVLRHLRFVATRRDGRSIRYRLHDGHVGVLLAEARNHLQHAAHGWIEPPRRERSAT